MAHPEDEPPSGITDQQHPVTSRQSHDEPPLTSTAHNHAAKRHAQKAAFAAFVTGKVAQKALRLRNHIGSTEDPSDEGKKHASLPISEQVTPAIIKNPREYQLELFERAKKENTIAVLDTGSGKTLIAVLLLRWIIDIELERRAGGQDARIAFFVVASVPLVYQQFAVIETNLDHQVAHFCGADGVDAWTKQAWREVFLENKVIVCTADILLQCLSRSYLSIRQINLLIFDEAHHAKKSHPFARIIKDFYLCERDDAARPRIFSMTASPVDGKAGFAQAAAELEALLHSRIATATDISITAITAKPTEHILVYEPPKEVDKTTTELWRLLYSYCGGLGVFGASFDCAKEINLELGRWCSNRYLLDVFSPARQTRLELEITRHFRARRRRDDMTALNAGIKALHDAIGETADHRARLSATALTVEDMTSKTFHLYHFLTQSFLRTPDYRCIVFVKQRYTALLLNQIVAHIQFANMRCDFLVGSNNTRIGETPFTLAMQVKTLRKFRKGEVNCLFATSVAEEGLDIPDCNLVIRFDPCDTMIQYVQSRGRARKQDSQFIHMVERSNSIHAQRLRQIQLQESDMRTFCQALPDDRRLTRNQDLVDYLMESERTLRTFTEASTGAKLTYGNALAYLAHFVTAIPTESLESQQPTYQVSPQDGGFIAEVILPSNAPVVSAVGLVRSRIAVAKRSAAFQACFELRKKGFLNEHFKPIYEKRLPEMRNALLAVDNKTTKYDMRVKPEVWKLRGSIPHELWLTVVRFCGQSSRPLQPLLFLTRMPVPDFPPFLIFLPSGDEIKIESTVIRAPLQIDSEQLGKVTGFTLRVFRDVFSKTYEHDAKAMSYWIVPANPASIDKNICSHDLFDWETIDAVDQNDGFKWTPETPTDFLLDKFLIDRWDGARKFWSVKIDASKSQTDPVPADAAKGKWNGSILDYSISLYKNARATAQWLPGQPVIVAELISVRRNLLAPLLEQEMGTNTKAYLCPEPLLISALPVSVAASSYIWPAIIHRYESHLIAMEACAEVGIQCTPGLSLAAITKDSDNSGEHDDPEKVNFQHGMGENYERLELLGDTFLKTATSMAVFIRFPNENEFEYHVRRMQMLCNKNLYNTAVKLRLYEYIRSMSFSRRLWYPEGLRLLYGTGLKRGETKVMFHAQEKAPLGEKTIADVCEALIGSAFVSHEKPGQWSAQNWTDAIRAVTVLVDSEDHTMMEWDNYRTAYDIPEYQVAPPTATQKDLASKVELKHAYQFRYPALLYSAFLHPSVGFLYEHIPDYQRLEFLGDSLLDLACVTYLFYKYPDKDPHWLTEHKMAMVSNRFLGALCVNLGFHKHLRHHHAILEQQVREYAAELHDAQQASLAAGNDPSSSSSTTIDYWTRISAPPKCLPDIIEAYIGAIFIDSDFNYAVVQEFFDAHIKPYFRDMTIYDTFAGSHPLTQLYHRLQRDFHCDDFAVLVQDTQQATAASAAGDEADTAVIAAVLIHGEVVGYSTGKSPRYAKIRAAQKALEALQGHADTKETFQKKFGCACVLADAQANAEQDGEDDPDDDVATETGSDDRNVTETDVIIEMERIVEEMDLISL